MTLTGDFADRAVKSYKTVEGKQLLSSVRQFLTMLDQVMAQPSNEQRGRQVAQLASQLEMAADRYDLFGEKDRRRKTKV